MCLTMYLPLGVVSSVWTSPLRLNYADRYNISAPRTISRVE